MNLDAKTQTRRCVLCSRGCSNVPRVKDHNGRYYCRTCYESASLALELGQPPSGQKPTTRRRKNGELVRPKAATVGSTRATGRREQTDGRRSQASRPSCHHELAANAVLCIDCGLDLRSGKKVDNAVAATGGAARADSASHSDGRARTLRRVVQAAGLLLIAAVSTVLALFAGH